VCVCVCVREKEHLSDCLGQFEWAYSSLLELTSARLSEFERFQVSFIGADRKILKSQFFIEFTVNKSLVPDFWNLTIHTRTINLVVMWIRRNPWGNMVQYVLCIVVKHIAVKCSVLQCVAVCCSVRCRVCSSLYCNMCCASCVVVQHSAVYITMWYSIYGGSRVYVDM